MIAVLQDTHEFYRFSADPTDPRRGFGNMSAGSIFAMTCKKAHFQADDGNPPMAPDVDDVVLTEMTLLTHLTQFCALSDSALPARTRN